MASLQVFITISRPASFVINQGFVMNSYPSKTSRDTAADLHRATDEAALGANRAIDSTREYAKSALDSAERRVGQLRSQVDPMVDMLATKAQKLARQSMDMASEARSRAEESFHDASAATSRYVSQQPVRSVLIAAAIGAAVALIVSSSRHRDDQRY
jgi:ElaB/YqjD/DUF883 family membrane-anchored ribosome-binding protein